MFREGTQRRVLELNRSGADRRSLAMTSDSQQPVVVSPRAQISIVLGFWLNKNTAWVPNPHISGLAHAHACREKVCSAMSKLLVSAMVLQSLLTSADAGAHRAAKLGTTMRIAA